MNKLNHDGLLVLEQPFVKVPLEQLKKSARTAQKQLDKDLSYVSQAVTELANKCDNEQIDPARASMTLENMVGRLQNLKRK
ncbi:6808_t:CDS:2, partial [Paraglomus occultum]